MKLARAKLTRSARPRRQWLFAYGELLMEGRPVNVLARGDLRARQTGEGLDAAAKFGEHGIVYGQRLPVSSDTLRFLDAEERPEYRRVKVDTSEGPAWAYESTAPDPEFRAMSGVPQGNWRRFTEHQKMADQVFTSKKGTEPEGSPKDDEA